MVVQSTWLRGQCSKLKELLPRVEALSTVESRQNPPDRLGHDQCSPAALYGGGVTSAFHPTQRPNVFISLARLAEGYEISGDDYRQWKGFHKKKKKRKKKKRRSALIATLTKMSPPTTDITLNDPLSSAFIDAGLTSEEYLRSLRVPVMRGRRPTLQVRPGQSRQTDFARN